MELFVIVYYKNLNSYVYVLLDEHDEIFYGGKGVGNCNGNRCVLDHFNHISNISPSSNDLKILNIWKNYKKPVKWITQSSNSVILFNKSWPVANFSELNPISLKIVLNEL